MGALAAQDMIEQTKAMGLSKDVALRWHLQSNHYPPLPDNVLPVARQAIKKASQGEWDSEVKLPAGMTWRGQKTAPVSACVEAWHLDGFIDQPEGGYFDAD